MTMKSVEELTRARRELDRQIRAAKRAEQKAEAQALSSAHTDLGRQLASLCGADSAEAVQALQQRAAQVGDRLRSALVASVPQASSHGDGGSQPSDNLSSRLSAPAATDEANSPVLQGV